jgi:2,4-diaminopentanoate dehydrogenase
MAVTLGQGDAEMIGQAGTSSHQGRLTDGRRRLVMIGAGPVAMAAASAALEDGAATSVVAVTDPADPARRDAVARLGGTPYKSVYELPPGVGDLAIVAFSSRAGPVAPVAVRAMELGCHVVTTCEELADPTPSMRTELARKATATGRSLVVAGANPGFVMDRLLLALADGCRDIRSVQVVRRLDSSTRRRPLVAKTGYGLTTEAFESGVLSGAVGHIGLEASARLVAEGLGWTVERVDGSIQPVIGREGLVAGQHQLLQLSCQGGRSVSLELTMAWGLPNPSDRIRLEGALGLDVEIVGGYPGDEGTTAQIVKVLANIGELAPGFYRPIDLPLMRLGGLVGPGRPGGRTPTSVPLGPNRPPPAPEPWDRANRSVDR